MSPLLLTGWLLAVASATLLLVARRQARESAERVVRACHELRGPLQNVLLGLGVDPSEASRPPLAAALAVELTRASRAVDDLASSATGTRRPDEVRTVALLPLVRDLVIVHDLVAARESRRVVLATPDADVAVTGDRARLTQAISNLVRNAVEHGEGTVRVGVGRARGAAWVEVADEGRGLQVPIDELLRARARARGMRIVAEALAAHGGRLRVAPPGPGTRMIAELPVAAGDRSGR